MQDFTAGLKRLTTGHESVYHLDEHREHRRDRFAALLAAIAPPAKPVQWSPRSDRTRRPHLYRG